MQEAEVATARLDSSMFRRSNGWVQRHANAETLLSGAPDGPSQQQAFLAFCDEALSSLAGIGFIEKDLAPATDGSS